MKLRNMLENGFQAVQMAVRKQQVQSEAVSTHKREFLNSTQLFNVENKIIP